MKKLYRSPEGSTARALKGLKHLDKMGKLIKVTGYRFRSTRGKNNGNPYTTTHERVLVECENGKARFDGFLWGYGGEGPRGLIQLLIKLGIPEKVARTVADSTRRDVVGKDFILSYYPDKNRLSLSLPIDVTGNYLRPVYDWTIVP